MNSPYEDKDTNTTEILLRLYSPKPQTEEYDKLFLSCPCESERIQRHKTMKLAISVQSVKNSSYLLHQELIALEESQGSKQMISEDNQHTIGFLDMRSAVVFVHADADQVE